MTPILIQYTIAVVVGLLLIMCLHVVPYGPVGNVCVVEIRRSIGEPRTGICLGNIYGWSHHSLVTNKGHIHLKKNSLTDIVLINALRLPALRGKHMHSTRVIIMIGTSFCLKWYGLINPDLFPVFTYPMTTNSEKHAASTEKGLGTRLAVTGVV